MTADTHALHSDWVQTLGLTIARNNGAVTGELPVTDRCLDAQQRLHHGVLASLVETLASVAAALNVGEAGQVVGVSNQTDTFLSPTSGTLYGEATAIDTGATEHLWRVDIRDADRQLVASGQVRLAVIRSALVLGN